MDDNLIARARDGDEEAFRRLVELYGGLAQRAARAFFQHREPAEDAVQEAWLDAWRGLSRFQAGKPFRPWLLKLVGNRCRMKVRRRRFPLVPFARAEAVQTNRSAEGDPALLLDRADPELAAALATLSEEQRRVLALRFYADLELNEVAQVLGVPVGTVKSRLHRALGILRSRLGQELGEELRSERVAR